MHTDCLLDYLCHHHILTAPDILSLSLHNSLQKLQVLNIATISLYAVDKVLDNTIGDFIAQGHIVLENSSHSLCLQELEPQDKKT